MVPADVQEYTNSLPYTDPACARQFARRSKQRCLFQTCDFSVSGQRGVAPAEDA